jgi:DNA-binding NarL/FixJ family response regulator
MITVVEQAKRGSVGPGAHLATLEQLRLLVVDDHPAVRSGLRELLDAQPDFEVTAAVASAEEAMAVAEHTELDVVVVDHQLGQGRNGLWLSRKLKRLDRPPKILIYSAYTPGPLAAAAVVAQADALVGKGAFGSELCDAVRGVAHGNSLLPIISPAVAEIIRRRLGEQEQAVFGMLLAGIAAAEIATIAGMSSAELQSLLREMLEALERLGTGHTGLVHGGGEGALR